MIAMPLPTTDAVRRPEPHEEGFVTTYGIGAKPRPNNGRWRPPFQGGPFITLMTSQKFQQEDNEYKFIRFHES